MDIWKTFFLSKDQKFKLVIRLFFRLGSHSPSDGPSHTHINAFSLVIRRFGNQSESVLRPPEVNRLLIDVFRKFRCGDASDSAAAAAVTDCQRVLDEVKSRCGRDLSMVSAVCKRRRTKTKTRRIRNMRQKRRRIMM